ncbi:hypothetical protein V2J09_016477 [Rumex salicifolius]
MIDQYNPHAKDLRMVKDRLKNDSIGDCSDLIDHRDIILERRNRTLKRINELHPSYPALQYPLLFPYGEDGYKIDIPLSDVGNTASRKRSRVSMREYFAFRIQERRRESKALVNGKGLFQHFGVNAYSMVESNRLNYI